MSLLEIFKYILLAIIIHSDIISVNILCRYKLMEIIYTIFLFYKIFFFIYKKKIILIIHKLAQLIIKLSQLANRFNHSSNF